MVIKSRPWGVITAHKVIKQLPCWVGTLEPGAWGPRSRDLPRSCKGSVPQAARRLGRWDPGSQLLEVEQMMPGWLGAGMGEPGREFEGNVPPFFEDSSCGNHQTAERIATSLQQRSEIVYGGLLWGRWGLAVGCRDEGLRGRECR